MLFRSIITMGNGMKDVDLIYTNAMGDELSTEQIYFRLISSMKGWPMNAKA